MRLNDLYLRNFRNYEELSLTFDKNITIFLGENAQVKTKLLDRI